MNNIEYKYSEITSRIIGCAMEVHKVLGCGFQEVIYQRALAVEFDLANLRYCREFEMTIYYKERQLGTRRVNFFVENRISVEIKALSFLEKVNLAQAMNYLEVYNLEIGMLINFGESSLVFKRLYNKKYNPLLPSEKSD